MSTQQPNLFDIPELPPYVKRSDTSRAAAESIVESAKTLEGRIYRWILGYGKRGRTCSECEVDLSMSHQTASARIRGLAQKGMVADSGKRRLTESNRAATVWIAREIV